MKKKYASIRTKTFFGIILGTLLISAVILSISHHVYESSMKKYYANLARNTAETVALAVNPDIVEKYSNKVFEIYKEKPCPEDLSEEENLSRYSDIIDDEFNNMKNEYSKLMAASEVESLYVIQIDKDSKSCVYIVDGDTSENGCAPGTWDIIYEQNYDVLEHPENGFDAYITNTAEYGWLVSCGAPIYSKSGNIIGQAMVDISMNRVMNEIKDFLYNTATIVLIVAFGISCIFAIYMDLSIVRPIKVLAIASKKIADKDVESESKLSDLQSVKIKSKDEIGMLSDTLKQMEIDINSYIKDITEITAEKERIGAELSVATNIQEDMLPSIFPAFPERKEFDIFASMCPAKEVGGDFYDFFMVDEKHIAMNISDVSGKGVPAALVMVIGKALIKMAAQEGLTPGAVLTRVNAQLCANNIEDMFITSWLGILDLTTGELRCANAGHEYPSIYRNGEEFTLYKDKHSFVLGGMEHLKYKEYELQINPGDKLFVYTDGVPEATNNNNELFGTSRMIDALNSVKTGDCSAVLEAVSSHVEKFVGDAPQFDDLTMLCFEFKEFMK